MKIGMSRRILARWIAVAGLVGCLVFPEIASAQNAQAILDDMDSAMEPGAYESQMTMRTVRPGKADLTMGLRLVARTGVGSLLEVTSPARASGTRFLQVDKFLWLYSPNSGSSRSIRLSPSQAFQGSAFSNGDISDPRFSEKYSARIDGTVPYSHVELGRIEVLLIEATPKNTLAEYSRVRAWVLPDTHAPVRIEYTAKSGLLFKRMEFSGFKSLAGRIRPSVYRMESLEEAGTYTTLIIESMKNRDDLGPSDFTQAALIR